MMIFINQLIIIYYKNIFILYNIKMNNLYIIGDIHGDIFSLLHNLLNIINIPYYGNIIDYYNKLDDIANAYNLYVITTFFGFYYSSDNLNNILNIINSNVTLKNILFDNTNSRYYNKDNIISLYHYIRYFINKQTIEKKYELSFLTSLTNTTIPPDIQNLIDTNKTLFITLGNLLVKFHMHYDDIIKYFKYSYINNINIIDNKKINLFELLNIFINDNKYDNVKKKSYINIKIYNTIKNNSMKLLDDKIINNKIFNGMSLDDKKKICFNNFLNKYNIEKDKINDLLNNILYKLQYNLLNNIPYYYKDSTSSKVNTKFDLDILNLLYDKDNMEVITDFISSSILKQKIYIILLGDIFDMYDKKLYNYTKDFYNNITTKSKLPIINNIENHHIREKIKNTKSFIGYNMCNDDMKRYGSNLSILTYIYVLSLKSKLKNNLLIIRGNHEIKNNFPLFITDPTFPYIDFRNPNNNPTISTSSLTTPATTVTPATITPAVISHGPVTTYHKINYNIFFNDKYINIFENCFDKMKDIITSNDNIINNIFTNIDIEINRDNDDFINVININNINNNNNSIYLSHSGMFIHSYGSNNDIVCVDSLTDIIYNITELHISNNILLQDKNIKYYINNNKNIIEYQEDLLSTTNNFDMNNKLNEIEDKLRRIIIPATAPATTPVFSNTSDKIIIYNQIIGHSFSVKPSPSYLTQTTSTITLQDIMDNIKYMFNNSVLSTKRIFTIDKLNTLYNLYSTNNNKYYCKLLESNNIIKPYLFKDNDDITFIDETSTSNVLNNILTYDIHTNTITGGKNPKRTREEEEEYYNSTKKSKKDKINITEKINEIDRFIINNIKLIILISVINYDLFIVLLINIFYNHQMLKNLLNEKLRNKELIKLYLSLYPNKIKEIHHNNEIKQIIGGVINSYYNYDKDLFDLNNFIEYIKLVNNITTTVEQDELIKYFINILDNTSIDELLEFFNN